MPSKYRPESRKKRFRGWLSHRSKLLTIAYFPTSRHHDKGKPNVMP
jgi:hypothetical protein